MAYGGGIVVGGAGVAGGFGNDTHGGAVVAGGLGVIGAVAAADGKATLATGYGVGAKGGGVASGGLGVIAHGGGIGVGRGAGTRPCDVVRPRVTLIGEQ
ncbi:MAG: hypothetical protein P8O76_01100 [Methylophilaceae bacterium]|nr:hypothetical protein [Methylophilaceae bacterium]